MTRSLFLSYWKLPAARPEKESGKWLSHWMGLNAIICPAKRIQILTLNAESAACQGALAKSIPIQERKRAGKRKPVAARFIYKHLAKAMSLAVIPPTSWVVRLRVTRL